MNSPSINIGRLSYIGRRSINFIKSEVNINIADLIRKTSYNFDKTQFTKSLEFTGPLGISKVNLVDGLNVNIINGATPEEACLKVDLDKQVFAKLNKYQRAFVKSMHGTTNTQIKSCIEGITEVFGLFTLKF